MKIEHHSAHEDNLYRQIVENKPSFETLVQNNQAISETKLKQVLEALESKNMIVFDSKTKTYQPAIALEPHEFVILDGNILLPVTVIEIPERGIKYVTRGNWYQFPIDFDIRKIIWNIVVDNKSNSTLSELIRTSILKEKKSKIRHNQEYDMLKGKYLPYCNDYKMLINSVGEELTDVTITFQIPYGSGNFFTGFTVRSEISTTEMLSQLNKPVVERNYNDIVVNRLYTLNDFITLKNEFPIEIDEKNNTLQYCKLTGVKNGYELTYYSLSSFGVSKKQSVENYDTHSELVEVLQKYFDGFISGYLNSLDFFISED